MGIPSGIKGWAVLIGVVAIAIAVIWRVPQLRALVTGS
jgi:hypothetical protein